MDTQPIRVFVDSECELEPDYFKKIMFKFNIMINQYHEIITHLTCHIFDPNYTQITDWIVAHKKSSAIIADIQDGYKYADTVLMIIDTIADCYNKVEYLTNRKKRVFIYCKRDDMLREVEECTSEE